MDDYISFRARLRTIRHGHNSTICSSQVSSKDPCGTHHENMDCGQSGSPLGRLTKIEDLYAAIVGQENVVGFESRWTMPRRARRPDRSVATFEMIQRGDPPYLTHAARANSRDVSRPEASSRGEQRPGHRAAHPIPATYGNTDVILSTNCPRPRAKGDRLARESRFSTSKAFQEAHCLAEPGPVCLRTSVRQFVD